MGDEIPADGGIAEAVSLQVNESSLTELMVNKQRMRLISMKKLLLSV